MDKEYEGYSTEDLELLIEWPCQDTLGGRMPFADKGFCKHKICHPLNDERIKKLDP